MKHLLRKYEALASEYEAEAYGFYEAKHTRVFPCAEGTLHEGKPCFIFHTPKVCFIRTSVHSEIIKNAQPKLCIFCIRPKVEIISSRTEVRDELP